MVNNAERELDWKGETYEKQGDTEILVGPAQVFSVTLRSHSFIHRIESELGVVMLDGWEIDPEGLLDAMDRSQFAHHRIKLRTPRHTIEGQW